MDVHVLILLIYLGVFRQSFGLIDKGGNKTLGRPASQSSTSALTYGKAGFRGVAGLAVDGKTDSRFNQWTCTHTAEGTLNTCRGQVDLQRTTTIHNVHILNRAELSERLHDFDVNVFEYRGKKSLCVSHPGAAGPGWVNLTCGSPPTGRYVRISKPSRNLHDPLTLCEVEIYGQYVQYSGGVVGEHPFLNCCSIC